MIVYKVQFETRAAELYPDRHSALDAMIRYAAETNMVACVIKYVCDDASKPMHVEEIVDFGYDPTDTRKFRIFDEIERDSAARVMADPSTVYGALHVTRFRSAGRYPPRTDCALTT
jgi:hypothetical protein